jgi:putative ABC transport system ATP-binding protein
MTPVLSARNLHKRFGLTPALRGADLDIMAGEIVAIMGPSGSGKSTLLHCLAGVLVPDEGHVLLSGADIGTLGEAARSRLRLTRFGFVFQFGQLLPELTAIDNVCLPQLLAGKTRSEARRESAKWLERLGIGEQAQKRPAQLSGGQAQRVAIARALAMHPDVLFADEPTGALDSLSAETTMTLMRNEVRAAGATLVLITHDPRTAAYADREVIIRDGRVSVDTRAVAA